MDCADADSGSRVHESRGRMPGSASDGPRLGAEPVGNPCSRHAAYLRSRPPPDEAELDESRSREDRRVSRGRRM